jgi:DNA-binding NarL/FixJ family response regulator
LIVPSVPPQRGGDGPEAGLSPADQGPVLLGQRQWRFLQKRYELTPREVQIAELVCRGQGNGRIAASLNIQTATVKTHIRNIYRKVRVKNKINMLLRFLQETQSHTADRTVASYGNEIDR